MSVGNAQNVVLRALEQFGREYGVEADGETWSLPFDVFHECVLTPAREGACVVMESPLLIVTEGRRSDLLRRAMQLNADPSRIAGGSLYFHQESGALVMRAQTAIGPEGGDGLSRALAGFIESARKILAEIVSGGAFEAPASEPFIDLLRV